MNSVSPHVNSIIGRTGKKGSDKGIDGIKVFVDDNSGKAKRVIVQVKSGHVKSGDIRDLRRSHPATGDKVSEMLQAFRPFIGENQMMAYLVVMAVRLNLDSAKAAAQSKRFMFKFFAKAIEVVYIHSRYEVVILIVPVNTRNLSIIRDDS